MDKNIRDNIFRFYDPLEMPGGWVHNHVEQLKTNLNYYLGKYKTGQYDNRGFRKFFYNITKPSCDVATKFIDLDTKDIILYSTRGDDELKVWFMQRKLKQWLKDNGFAELLNEIATELPKGHVVIKKVGRKWKRVPLTNIRTDVSAKYLNDSDHVYELHPMSRTEIENADFSDQKNVQELLDRGDDQVFYIYECYAKKGDKWTRTVHGDLFTAKKGGDFLRTTEAQINRQQDYLPSLVLDETEVSKLPYREIKWEDMDGRWLGYGFCEYLEDNQIATNEAENLERKGLSLKALQLWQTRDDTIGGSNVLSEAEPGDILKIESEVTPIAKENSDLAAFNSTRARWDKNSADKTFNRDISNGADLPSRTPLGVANLQAGAVASYFDLKRENFGLFIKALLLEDIIPDFKEETAKEHMLTFLGSDEELDKLDKFICDIKVGDASVAYALKTGFFPSKLVVEDARMRIKDQLKQARNRYMKIPAGFYENAHYFLDINVTGEQTDVGAKSQIIQMAMQLVQGGALQNKASRKMLFSLMGLGGVSPVDLGLMDEDFEQQQPMQPQGSMAAPRPAAPSQMPTSTQI